MIKSKRKNCNSSQCIAFGSEFNEKFQKNRIFFSRSPLRHLISNSVGSSILCSAAINFNTSLAAAVQSKRLHNGVKTSLLSQNYFIESNHGDSKGASDNHSLFTLKNKDYFDPKKPNLTDNQLFGVDDSMYRHLNFEFGLPMKI